jgi:NADH-quinone oxidoreductase subunit K
MKEYIELSLVISFIALYGLLVFRHNIINTLMALELLLLSVNLNFILISIYLDDILGQIFSLFILTIAAAESAIALALLVVFYRRKGSIDLNLLQHLKA